MSTKKRQADATVQPGLSESTKIPAGDSGNFAKRERKLLSEPLFHFFLVAAIVFGAYWLFDKGPEPAADEKQIVITENDIRQLAISWLAQGRSSLTKEQMQSLIQQKIAEEVLFREGVALGLDQNDEIIKRRVAQKMDFLTADVAALQEPEPGELEQWYADNKKLFEVPPRASFRQLYFSPDRRGNETRADAQSALEAISANPAIFEDIAASADSFALRSFYNDTTPDFVLKEFGPAFATELFKLQPGTWHGPVQSGFGWHLVFIDVFKPARIPSYDEVKLEVEAAWHDARYLEIKRRAYEEMRELYTVKVAPIDSIDLRDLNSTIEVDPTLPTPVAR